MTEPVIRFAAAAPGDIQRKAATVNIQSEPQTSRTKDAEIASLVRTLGMGNLFASPDAGLEQFVYAHNIHVWVYRCCQVISKAMVRAVPKQYLHTKKGRELLPPDHPAALVLDRPNKWTTGSQMREKWGISLSITGMIYLLMDQAARSVWHLRSDRMTIFPDPDKYIDRFEYDVNGQQIKYSPEVVTYHKYENPNNDYYGLSPLKAATNAVSQYLSASRWNLHFFKNAAAPLGILTTDYTFRNKKEINRIAAQWRKLYSGYKRFGSTAVLGSGMKFQAITPKHVDMAFLELLEFTKNEIGGAFGVPPIFLNDREGVNYANLREYERMFWRHKMIPELILLEDWLNQFVNPVWTGPGEVIKTKFDLGQVEALQEDIVKEAEAARIKIFSGQESPDEARERRGLQPWPDGSGASAMVPMSFVRLDQAGDVLAGKIPATGQTPPKGARSRIVKFPRSVFKTPAERMDHVMRIKGLVDEEEALMKTVLVAVMEDWTQEMLENIGADKGLKVSSDLTVEAIIFDQTAAEAQLAAVGAPIFEDTARRAGEQGMALTGAAVAFDLADPAVQEILTTRTQRFAEQISAGQWERMKLSLNEGISAGESNKVLAERVRVHMGREINNAATIARTEIHPCYESVNLQAYKQSGVCEGKEWLAAFLPRSRQDHTDNDGVQVSLNSAFLVGGEWLDYPGDPGGRPDNIINCLCTTAPVVIAPVEPVISLQ